MKKFLCIFAQLILISTVSVVPVYAQTVTQSPREIRQEARVTIQQQRLDTRVADLKSRADTEIERRITSLTNLSTKISGFKHLSDSQKNTFSSEIQTEISSLTTLKNKIDTQDTDITTLRTDVQSIVKEYRVYVVYMPQLNIIAAADKILDIADQLTAIENKLQTRITQAQSNGQNISTEQTELSDMQNKISDAQTQANNAIAAVVGLTPSGYPGNVSSLQSARKMLQTGRLDLVNAGKDAKTIIQEFKAMRVSATNAPEPTQ